MKLNWWRCLACLGIVLSLYWILIEVLIVTGHDSYRLVSALNIFLILGMAIFGRSVQSGKLTFLLKPK